MRQKLASKGRNEIFTANSRVHSIWPQNKRRNFWRTPRYIFRRKTLYIQTQVLTTRSWNGRVKAKRCFTTRHGGDWRGWRYSSYSLLTSALDGGERSASRPGRALLRGKDTRYPLYRRLGGPQSRSGQRPNGRLQVHKQLLNYHPKGRRRPLKRLLDDVNAETERGHPGLNSWWNMIIIITNIDKARVNLSRA
jgi:hypothetical protein